MDNTIYINRIRDLGYSAHDVVELLDRSTSNMPVDFNVVFNEWRQVLGQDEMEVLKFAKEAGLALTYKERLLDEIANGIYNKLLGWAAFGFFVREYMKDKANDVLLWSSAVDDLIGSVEGES